MNYVLNQLFNGEDAKISEAEMKEIKDSGLLSIISKFNGKSEKETERALRGLVKGNEESQTEGRLRRDEEKSQKVNHTMKAQDLNEDYGKTDIPEYHVTKEYPHTIYHVLHHLDSSQYAEGKNTGWFMTVDEEGDFVDEDGDQIPLSRDLMNDVFMIQDKKKEVEVTFEEASNLLKKGENVRLEYARRHFHLTEYDELSRFPITAVDEGTWVAYK